MSERDYYEINVVTPDGTPLVMRVHPRKEPL